MKYITRNFDRCPACGISVCLGECGLPVINGDEGEF